MAQTVADYKTSDLFVNLMRGSPEEIQQLYAKVEQSNDTHVRCFGAVMSDLSYNGVIMLRNR